MNHHGDTPAAEVDPFAEVFWRDVQELRVEGKGWAEASEPFDRLPRRAEAEVRPEVWRLARQPAGLHVRFVTNSPELYARWELADEMPESVYESPTGMAGLDCYGKGPDGWRWVGATTPWKLPDPDGRFNSTTLDGEEREYMVYLPRAARIRALAIGIKQGASFRPAPRRPGRPIAYYGTSIVHGACVSRPGMLHASILGRRLEREVINLGFAGNGRLEEPIARLLAELDPALYIVDCLPNVDPHTTRERLPKLVAILRAARPETPILLVGDRLFGDASFAPRRAEIQGEKNRAQRETVQRLQAEGVTGLHLLEPANPFGEDFEGTIDGSHPTDLGAFRMAEALLPAVRALLTESQTPAEVQP